MDEFLRRDNFFKCNQCGELTKDRGIGTNPQLEIKDNLVRNLLDLDKPLESSQIDTKDLMLDFNS